jgi:SAM-dependent methyltransferase
LLNGTGRDKDKLAGMADKRFRKLPGLDYKKGAIDYPRKLDANNRYHLYTKPFYNLANKISRWTEDGLDDDTYRHFCDFANIARALALPAGATILDVGCGSGWLCEFFARLGYKTTGIDLSPEMIAIAEERISKLPYGADQETALSYSFLAHDIETGPLPETFDAVICYDALHHFEDEHAVLTNLNAMLKYGGQLFVVEGEKPPMGSGTEDELRNVMDQYATLESPFSRDYLLELLQAHGFSIVGDYATVSGLVERENFQGSTIQFVESPNFNYLLGKKTSGPEVHTRMSDSLQPGLLRARLTLESDWPNEIVRGAHIEFLLGLENTGDNLWLVSRAPLTGRIRLGTRLINSAGETIEEIHGDPAIQRALAPGEHSTLHVNRKAPTSPGQYTLKIDLVNQNICWFEEHGSLPLQLELIVI